MATFLKIFKKVSRLAAVIPWCLPWGMAAVNSFCILVDHREPEYENFLQSMGKSFNGMRMDVFETEKIDQMNPINYGLTLSKIADFDVVITLGETASAFVNNEFDEGRFLHLDTNLIHPPPPAGIIAANTYMLTFSSADLVRNLMAVFPKAKTLGILYSQGYETIVENIGQQCQKNSILDISICANEEDIIKGPTLRQIVENCDVILVLGRKNQNASAVFTYLIQQSLPKSKPVLGASSSQLKTGAFAVLSTNFDSLPSHAIPLIRNYFAEPPEKVAPVLEGPAPVSLHINKKLMDFFQVKISDSITYKLYN